MQGCQKLGVLCSTKSSLLLSNSCKTSNASIQATSLYLDVFLVMWMAMVRLCPARLSSHDIDRQADTHSMQPHFFQCASQAHLQQRCEWAQRLRYIKYILSALHCSRQHTGSTTSCTLIFKPKGEPLYRLRALILEGISRFLPLYSPNHGITRFCHPHVSSSTTLT